MTQFQDGMELVLQNKGYGSDLKVFYLSGICQWVLSAY
ncbi:hypothetical protein P872_09575 [Rhodonellum psychrophilum GCM71 = DSM 17998]|uniref:Uncharacterized protein n=2 Tax=Rhodonellum TaxID=336827 RepID=U5BLL8_9BACT|nr:hypothetical protein P872_09575 [Rhodonellum psychrophilum GCM71 = DSM 17998]SDZ40322.1 hypothetical protein SAMN05444412_11320 [Rhodonellum ikkaensis]